MKFFPKNRQKKVKEVLARSGADRRQGDVNMDMSLNDYLAVEGTDRQDNFVIRANIDRREDRAGRHLLGNLL